MRSLISFLLLVFAASGTATTIPVVTEHGNWRRCGYLLWICSSGKDLVHEFSFRMKRRHPFSSTRFYRFDGPDGPFVMMFHSPLLFYADAQSRIAVTVLNGAQAVTRYSNEELLVLDGAGNISRVKGKERPVRVVNEGWKTDPAWKFRDLAFLGPNHYAFLAEDRLVVAQFTSDPAAPPRKLDAFPFKADGGKKFRVPQARQLFGDEHGVWIEVRTDTPVKKVGALYFNLDDLNLHPAVLHQDNRQDHVARNLLGFDPVSREAYWIQGNDYTKISPDSAGAKLVVNDWANPVLPAGITTRPMRRVFFDPPTVFDGDRSASADVDALLNRWEALWKQSNILGRTVFSESVGASQAWRSSGTRRRPARICRHFLIRSWRWSVCTMD